MLREIARRSAVSGDEQTLGWVRLGPQQNGAQHIDPADRLRTGAGQEHGALRSIMLGLEHVDIESAQLEDTLVVIAGIGWKRLLGLATPDELLADDERRHLIGYGPR